MKLRYLLPLFQLLLALALLLAGSQQLQSTQGHQKYGDFAPPPTRICYALNAPAAVVRWWLAKARDGVRATPAQAAAIFDDTVFLVSVGAMWFLIGLQIETWRRGDRTILPLNLPLRIGVYVLVTIFIATLAIVGAGAWATRSWRYTPGIQASIEGTLYLAWALVFSIVYGRELLKQLASNRSAREAV